jgi:hypothetical protein
VKSFAQQQWNRDDAGMSCIGQIVEYLLDAGLTQVEKRDADIEIRTPSTQDVDGAVDRLARAGIAAAVRYREQSRHAGTADPSSTAASALPTRPAASVLPPAGSISKKLPVCLLTA